MNEAWIDEVTQQGAFGAAPSGSANRVLRRHYVALGDQSTYYAVSSILAWRRIHERIYDPSSHRPEVEDQDGSLGRPRRRSLEQDSYLLAAQAYYFKRKLVFAGGYREYTLYLHEGRRWHRSRDAGIHHRQRELPRSNRRSTPRPRRLAYIMCCPGFPCAIIGRIRRLAITGVRPMPFLDSNGYPMARPRVGGNPKGEGVDMASTSTLDGKIFVRAINYHEPRRRSGLHLRWHRGQPDVFSTGPWVSW